MFGTFCDIATNPEANEEAAKFIRRKIAEIVKDPETAPQAHPDRPVRASARCATRATTRRSTAPTSRWSTSRRTPIVADDAATGVRTADGALHELDVLVFATGFDAVDGNYVRVDLRGRDGRAHQRALERRADQLPRRGHQPASPTCS